MRHSIDVSLLFIIASLCACVATADTQLKQAEYKTKYGERLLYQRYTPENLTKGEKIPLILFLHGAGERGNDNKKQTMHGVPQIVQHLTKTKQKAIVIAPQCPNGMQWVNTPWRAKAHTMPEFPSMPMRLAIQLVQETMATQPIDPTRIYVAGLSMGGYGTWDVIQRKPDLFAAAIPVCGGADATIAARIAHIPIWAWHGDKDGVVPVNRSRDAIAALKAAGGTPKYTELPSVGHNAWTPAFQSTELLKWLFIQRKK